jgi:hypothetical protein
MLEFRFAGTEGNLDFQEYFQLGNLDGLAAMHGVVERAADLIPDVRTLDALQREEFVFDLMRVLQRTILAIWRGHGASVRSDMLYDFFDGNLRDLFSFSGMLSCGRATNAEERFSRFK